MTVGDLRDLHDEDWVGIGLTVFALRALKNMLKGKRLAAEKQAVPLSPPVYSLPSKKNKKPLLLFPLYFFFSYTFFFLFT
ncbi:hypothetical protein K501DRAFT_82392 [Backusella circina FSU 941]|nr:hypothetical protein K501DRAFT_82392 [Backusella circina FSU 941]